MHKVFSMPSKDVIEAVEKDIKELDVFYIELTKDEVLDLVEILNKEQENCDNLLAKLTDILKQ